MNAWVGINAGRYEFAKQQFLDEATEQGIEATVPAIEFLEFDSGNPHHAAAYFEVTYTAAREWSE